MSTAAILDAAGVVINIVVAEHLEISGSVDGSDAAIGDTWDGARFVRPGSNEQPPEPIPMAAPGSARRRTPAGSAALAVHTRPQIDTGPKRPSKNLPRHRHGNQRRYAARQSARRR